MRTAIILALLALPAAAAPPSTCRLTDDYSVALCSYQRRDFRAAERQLRAIADAGAETPNTVRAHYFLARTLMKTGRYAQAEDMFIRIYALDKPFYDAWACDFLLGECRRAQGKS